MWACGVLPFPSSVSSPFLPSPPLPSPAGWLEVMQDRRLMQDDNRGLGQGVTDNIVTQLSFRLLLETVKQPAPVSLCTQ